jgi:Raf kinase inhibitor-like YbhB/YbcL family protein
MPTSVSVPTVSVAAPQGPAVPTPIQVTSQSFPAGGTLPASTAFTAAGGQNRSPQLAWKNFPRETKSFALICFDPDAPTGSGFYHWVAANIPASVTSLPEDAGDGSMPAGAVQGMTDYGFSHYGGPYPPKGDQPHPYRFTIYALDVPAIPGVGPTTSGALLVFMMRGHLLAQGTLEGHFGTKKGEGGLRHPPDSPRHHTLRRLTAPR